MRKLSPKFILIACLMVLVGMAVGGAFVSKAVGQSAGPFVAPSFFKYIFGTNSITTISPSNGLYLTGSSTVDSTFRVTGNFTLAGIASGNCLQTGTGGLVQGTGSACGAGGGGSGDSVWGRDAAKGLLYTPTTTDDVCIGCTATSTTAKLNITGGLWATGSSTFNSTLRVNGNFTVSGLTPSRCVETGAGGVFTVAAAACGTGSGGGSNWQIAFPGQPTLTPTSTTAGTFVLASSTFNDTLRVNGALTLSGLTGMLRGNGTSAVTATTTLSVNNGGTGAGTFTLGGFILGGGTSPLTASAALTGVVIGNGTSAPTASTTLSVNSGGTGAATFTSNGVLLGGGTSPITASTAFSANGQLLIGNGSSAPSIATLTAGGGIGITNGAGSITITGAANGTNGAWQNAFAGQATLTPTSTTAGIFANGSSTINNTLRIQPSAAANSGLDIAGFAGQTANLYNNWNSSQTFLSGFTAAGGLLMNISSTTALRIQNGSGSTQFVVDSTNGSATTTGIHNFGSTGAGDSAVQFVDNNVEAFVMGNDDSANQFVISVGSALGTNDALQISSLKNATSTGHYVMNGLTNSAAAANAYLCLNAADEILEVSTTCLVSALKYKQNLRTFDHGLDYLMAMKPTMFDFRDQYRNGAKDQIGFIADDMAKIDPNLGIFENGEVENFDDRAVLAVIVNSIQQLADIKGIKRSAEENWQWLAIGFLALGMLYQQAQIRRLKK